jgi:hypothetical protein
MSARQARPVWMFGAPMTGVFFLAYRGLAHVRPSPARRLPIVPARPLVVEEGSLPPHGFSLGLEEPCRAPFGASAGLFGFTTRRLRSRRDGPARRSAGESRCPSDRDPNESVDDAEKNPEAHHTWARRLARGTLSDDLPVDDKCQHSGFRSRKAATIQHRSRNGKVAGGHERLFSDNAVGDSLGRRSEEETKGI